MRNKYKIENDDYAIIYLDRRKAESLECYISLIDLNKVLRFDVKWCAYWSKFTQSHYAQATEYLGMDIDNKPKYKSHKLHMYILETNSEQTVDHKTHNTLDNRRENLKIVSREENSKNRKGRNRNNSTGYRNVSYISKKYVVQLQINKRNTVMGKFNDVHEAGRFAEEMRKIHYIRK